MPTVSDYICVAATVLPSMKKDRVYHVVIVINESTARAITACCACPAELLGCCNHVTATLYCLEDYIHSGLKEDELKGCIERLQVWNQPRNRHVKVRPTDNVNLIKEQYGSQKRLKIHHVNKWDCHCRKIIDPNKVRRLGERLFTIEQSKLASINDVLQQAKTPVEKKGAAQARSQLTKYGSSWFFLQLFDDDPPPQENHIDEMKKKGLRGLLLKRKDFKKIIISARLVQVKLDHSYSVASNDVSDNGVTEEKEVVVLPHLAKEFMRVMLC